MALSRLARGKVATVKPDCTLREAARMMGMLSVGALVIADSARSHPLGIVTDRDIVKMIGEGLDPDEADVACLVGPPLKVIGEGEPTHEVVARMRQHGVRRLPIVDAEGSLAGIVSLDDVLLRLGEEMADVAATLRKEFEREHALPSAHDRAE